MGLDLGTTDEVEGRLSKYVCVEALFFVREYCWRMRQGARGELGVKTQWDCGCDGGGEEIKGVMFRARVDSQGKSGIS
jgi:hypothetical protein